MIRSVKTKESPEKTIERFFAKFSRQTYAAGDIILRADQPPPGVFYLKKGFVRQYTVSSRGEVFVLHVFRPGSHFLMMWAFNGTPNQYYYEAITPAEVYRAPLASVREFFERHPSCLYYFTKRLLSGVSGLLSRIECLMLESAQVRTALLLLYLSKTYGEEDGNRIAIRVPLTHKEIASWIGTTRETASLQMESLRRKGLIAYGKRQIVVVDRARLKALAS